MNEGKQRTEHEEAAKERENEEDKFRSRMRAGREEGGVSKGRSWNGFRTVHFNMGPWLINKRWVGGATRRSQSRHPLRLRHPRSPRGGGVDPASLSVDPAHAAETPPDRPVESRHHRCRSLQMSPDPPLHTHTQADEREGVRQIDSVCVLRNIIHYI